MGAIVLRHPQFKPTDWIRTCQECGHAQVMKSPEGQKSDTWREAKCRRCKSESLDYGTPNAYQEEDEEPLG